MNFAFDLLSEINVGSIEYFAILLPLALIIFFGKAFGMGARKIGLPSVIGMLLAGVLIGFIRYIPSQTIITDEVMIGVKFFAKVGVVLIMFSVGLETDLSQIRSTGVASVVITTMGVVCPMAFGFIVSACFNGWGADMVMTNLFYGAILTATSVSVTVATLKEMGKLNSKVGTSIVAAAIIDDVIGIVILSVLLGFSDTGAEESGLWSFLSFGSSWWFTLILIIAFFAIAIFGGMFIRRLFKWMIDKFGHHKRTPIFALAVCFLYSWTAEYVFGVADITGAYLAGIILGHMRESEYIDKRTDESSYMIFTPVFFASIGMTLDFSGITWQLVAFGLCYVLAGIAGKLLGCGLGAKMTKFSNKDAFRVGVGMMARAEVVLICTEKGISSGLVDPGIMPFVFVLIIVTSFLTPLLLKVSYKKDLMNGETLPIPQYPTESKNTVSGNDDSYLYR